TNATCAEYLNILNELAKALSKIERKENDAGEVRACIIIRVLFSIIEFQSQLYVSWGLGACNLPHRGSQTHIRCVELDVVEGIDEVGSELQFEPLRNHEILMQAQIDVGVMRGGYRSELRCAISESPN